MYQYPRQKSNTGTIAIAVALIVLGFFSYQYFMPGDADAQNTDSNGNVQTEVTSVVSEDLLNSLGRIESLQIDTSLFEDTTYQSLQDQSVTIAPQPTGKANPFAPITAPVKTPVKTTTRR